MLFERDQADGLFARDIAETLDRRARSEAETAAAARPRRRRARRRARPSRRPGDTTSSASRRATGTMRDSPSRWRKMPSVARGGRSRTRMTRAVKPPVSGSGVRRASTRSPIPGARAPRAFAFRRDDDARGVAPFLVPLDRNADRLALVVDAFHREHGDGGEVARPVQMLAAALDQPFVGKLAQDALQGDLLPAGKAEGAGDVALARLAGAARRRSRGSPRGSGARAASSLWASAAIQSYSAAALALARGFLAGALRPFDAGFFAGARPALSARSSTACSSVTSSGFNAPGKRGVHLAMIDVRPVATGANGDRAALGRMLAEALQRRRRSRAHARSSSRREARSRGWRRP